MGKRSACARSASDSLSVQLVERVRAEWRAAKRRPPAERKVFLRTQEAIAVLGAKVCNDLLKEIDRRGNRVRDLVPGDAWLEAWEHRQQLQPLVAFTSTGSLVPQADGRNHSVRLQLSRATVRSGLGDCVFAGATTGTRRLTPPQAVEVEDAIDALTPDEAAWRSLTWPDSPSAIAILRIEVARARPIDGNW